MNTQLKPKVSLNSESKLFVIRCGSGYSCYGFQNCYKDASQLYRVLGLSDLTLKPSLAEVGTIKQYEQYESLLAIASKRPPLPTWFNPGTDSSVQTILELAIKSRQTLRLFFGDKETGRDWLEEYDVVGHIGRSTGVLKIPLLITKGEDGGPAVSTDSIVKIQDNKNVVLYQHPSYHLPALTIADSDLPEYKANVLTDGNVHARFKTLKKAEKFVSFLRGECLKP